MAKKIINSLMLVTGIRPLYITVRVSGTYKGQQRIAELPDQNNIPRIGYLIKLGGILEQGDHRKVLKADWWKLAPVTTTNIFEYIKGSKSFKRILNSRQLKALHDTYINFPKRFIAVMSGNRSKELTQIVKCSIVATKLELAWSVKICEIKTVLYLESHGLNCQEALTMLDLYKSNTINVVNENPYTLIPVVGFDRADNIGTKNGIDKFDPRRMIALGIWLISLLQKN